MTNGVSERRKSALSPNDQPCRRLPLGGAGENSAAHSVLINVFCRASQSEASTRSFSPSLGRLSPNDAPSCGRAPRGVFCSSWRRNGLSTFRDAIFAPRFSILPHAKSLFRVVILRRRIFSRRDASAWVALCHDAPIWPGLSPSAKLRAHAWPPILFGARCFSRFVSPPARPARYSPPHGPARRR